MPALTEPPRSGEFIVGQSHFDRSMGVQVFDSTTDWGGAAIVPGQVYSIVGGAAVAYDGDASDGSEVAAGILYEGVAAGKTKERAVLLRDATVDSGDLTYSGDLEDLTNSLAGLGLGVAGVYSSVIVPGVGSKVAWLLIGQSNTVGQAPLGARPDFADGVLAYDQSGTLAQASVPLPHYNTNAGEFGPALYFSSAYMAANSNHTLAFIPSAEGGTGFDSIDNDEWEVGDALYNTTVARANAFFTANPDYEFGGFIWIQGERDAARSASATYQASLDALIAGMRSEITVATDSTPFLIGEIGQSTAEALAIRAIQLDTPRRLPYTAVFPSPGVPGVDGTHYDAAQQESIGLGFYPLIADAIANEPREPSAPVSLTATPGDGEVALVAEAPTFDGHGTISGYVWEFSTDSGSSWSVIGGATGLTYTHASLTNGTGYDYRVSATNEYGTSTGYATGSATPIAPPASIEILSQDASEGVEDGSTAEYTWAGITTATGRAIISIAARQTGTPPTASSVTLGGAAATLVNRTVTTANVATLVYEVAVTGTSNDLVVQFDDCAWTLAGVTCVTGGTATVTGSGAQSETTAANTLTVNAAEGAAVIITEGVTGSGQSTPTFDLNGVTPDAAESEWLFTSGKGLYIAADGGVAADATYDATITKSGVFEGAIVAAVVTPV